MDRLTEDGSDWRDQAACTSADPEIFFVDKGATTTAARKVCSGCPVQRECLDHAIRTREIHGIWGGLSIVQRKRFWR